MYLERYKCSYMKNNTERNATIFKLWQSGYSYQQIANTRLESNISLRRIRNIIYAGKKNLKSEHEKKIYTAFQLKFLELQDVKMSIKYVWENQPMHTLCETQIRRIINTELQQRRQNSQIKNPKSK